MEMTLVEFVVFVVFGACLLVLVFTAVSRALHARSESRSLSGRFVCRLCLHAYEDHSHAPITRCPHCGAANERDRNRRFC
jgi:Zn finger protein HypA/HybF involved in hydrogenase expression